MELLQGPVVLLAIDLLIIQVVLNKLMDLGTLGEDPLAFLCIVLPPLLEELSLRMPNDGSHGGVSDTLRSLVEPRPVLLGDRVQVNYFENIF